MAATAVVQSADMVTETLHSSGSAAIGDALERSLLSFFQRSSPIVESTSKTGTSGPAATDTHRRNTKRTAGLFASTRDEDLFGALETKRRNGGSADSGSFSLQATEKSTFAATTKALVPLPLATSTAWVNPLRKNKTFVSLPDAGEASRGGRATAPWRESLTELVAKKREIFLVQLGLDVKTAEIDKLRVSSVQRATALSKAEKLLEEDSKRFEDFLRENGEKLQEAIARADAETRAKQDKIAEIKRWQGIIAGMRSELSRSEEQLEDAKRLQGFLEDLTPVEWREGLVAARDERHVARLTAWRAECESVQSQQQAAKAAKSAAEQRYEEARTEQEANRAQADIKAAAAALKEAQALMDPPEPELEALDPDAFYFQEPEQLLELFDNLEAQNLALIQSSQEAGIALDDAKARQRAEKARLDAESQAVQAQVRQLEQLKCDAQLGASTRERAPSPEESKRTSTSALGLEPTYEELCEWVTEAYVECGFQREEGADVVRMMTAIEARCDECIRAAAQLPPGAVEEGERLRERERRQAAREAKKRQEEQEYRARMDRAEQRAAAPTFKRVGKPEMARSYLSKARAPKAGSRGAYEAEVDLQRFIDQVMV